MPTTFKTAKAAITAAKKSLATVSEAVVVVAIDAEPVEDGFQAIVTLDASEGQSLTEDDSARLAEFFVRLTEGEVLPVATGKPERAKSEVSSPVSICREVVTANPQMSRKELVALLISKGVNPATAGTQVNRIRKTLA